MARKPELMAPDADAEYFEVIEIDLNEIKEPYSPAPTTLMMFDHSLKLRRQIDEVFIGSCMTNIGHFRAAAQMLGDAKSIPYAFVDLTPNENGSASTDGGRRLQRVCTGWC